jgi:hypothetical protein
MASADVFVPRARLDARENLSDFILFCRNELTVFGASLDWDANYWPESGVTFGNLDNKGRLLQGNLVMQHPFLEFAKAYHRYKQGMRPAKSKIEMRALKCLERALVKAKKPISIESINLRIFDSAAGICKVAYTDGLAYRAGRELERIAKFLEEKRLVGATLDWKSPIPRPSDTVRTGIVAKRRREKKLPPLEVLNALAAIFASRPIADRDIFTSSCVAMLMSAPNRGSEVLSLALHCEVKEETRNGSIAYGWGFIPGKGGPPEVKWIPDVMAQISMEAIDRIRRITVEARRLAAWLEDHPEEFFRHEGCPNVPEDQPLTVLEACVALGYKTSDKCGATRTLQGIGAYEHERALTLRHLNGWVHANQPPGFPWFDRERNLLFRDALFCMRARQLRGDHITSPVLLWRPTVNVLNNDLGYRQTAPNYSPPNVWKRNSALLGDVSPPAVTSHQFRHYLNTVAQRDGLAQSDLARWSGRADPLQNRVYDHMSEFELSDKIRSQDSALALDAPLKDIAAVIAANMPKTRQEFNLLTDPVVHITEIGFCVHDFVLSPCQLFRDCLNCSQQVCVKGDERLRRLRERRALVETQVHKAKQEIAEGSAGADRWYEIQMKTLDRLNALITILEDPNVPDGAIIRLRDGNEFNPLKRAMASRLESSVGALELPSATGGDGG